MQWGPRGRFMSAAKLPLSPGNTQDETAWSPVDLTKIPENRGQCMRGGHLPGHLSFTITDELVLPSGDAGTVHARKREKIGRATGYAPGPRRVPVRLPALS